MATTNAAFPGPTVSGICLMAGPLLGIAGCVGAIGIYRAQGPDFVHAMGTHAARTAALFNLQIAATALLFFAALEVARRVTPSRPGLGRAGGMLTMLGLLGPMFFNGVYFGAYQLAGGPSEAAAGFLVDHAQIIPSVIANVFGPCLIAGPIVLAVGAAKTGVLSRRAAWALGLLALLPFGFISGVIAISAAGQLGAAIALCPLGLQVLRGAD